MLQREILWDEAGILAMGREGEGKYGRRNFLELFSVFMSPPLFSILHGRQELGYVDEMTFLGKHEGPRVLLLGGRSWRVNHIDWQRRIAYVEATELTGRSRWKGEGRGLGFRLSQAIKRILATDECCRRWSRRATERMGEIRQEFPWLAAESSVVVLAGDGETEWWTFGGNRANATLAQQLAAADRQQGKPRQFHADLRSCGQAARRPASDRQDPPARRHRHASRRRRGRHRRPEILGVPARRAGHRNAGVATPGT
jgi:ATP-dependent helicase Lhr and Lhr-like helicase